MESQRPKRKAAEAAIASIAQSQQSPKKRTPSSSRKGRKNRKQQEEKTAEATPINPVEHEQVDKETPKEEFPSETIKETEKLENVVPHPTGTKELANTENETLQSKEENSQEKSGTTTVQVGIEHVNAEAESNTSVQPTPPPYGLNNAERSSEGTSNNIAVNNIVEEAAELPHPTRERLDVGSNPA